MAREKIESHCVHANAHHTGGTEERPRRAGAETEANWERMRCEVHAVIWESADWTQMEPRCADVAFGPGGDSSRWKEGRERCRRPN